MSEFTHVGIQIGQCHIVFNQTRTIKWYASLPKITENCNCGGCVYYENEIVQKDIRLFRILQKIGVDLTRQPRTDECNISSVGPIGKFMKAYIGCYRVFGRFSKVQRKHTKNAEGKIESVDFYEPTEDMYVQYKISQIKDDELEFRFYIECEKIEK